MIVFILGRTGSGKSTTVRFLREVAQYSGWSVQSFNDYPFLRKMFETDTSHRFRATAYGGFEVVDQSVFQIAIRSLAQQVQSYYVIDNQALITVEFTSNNYRESLRFFSNELLREAYILFLNADLKSCLERASNRIFHYVSEDDYYVKDTVLLKHYPCPYMPLRIGERKVHFIYNMDSLGGLETHIKNLVPLLLSQENESHTGALQRKTMESPHYEYISSPPHQWVRSPTYSW